MIKATAHGNGRTVQAGAEFSLVVGGAGAKKVWARDHYEAANVVTKHATTRTATDVHHRYRMDVVYRVEAYSWQESHCS